MAMAMTHDEMAAFHEAAYAAVTTIVDGPRSQTILCYRDADTATLQSR